MGEHRLFFVRGHPRSGTNWTDRLLNLHPAINCRGEFNFEGMRQQLFGVFLDRPWHVAHDEPCRSEALGAFQDLVQRCILSQRVHKPEASWIGDRSPNPLIPLIPGTPHLYVFRDGRDVLVSWTFHQMRRAAEGAGPLKDRMASQRAAFEQDHHHFAAHPEQLLADESWVRETAAKWRTRLDHDLATIDQIERGEVDARVHRLRYEDLLDDTEAGRRDMYEFLGVNPDDADDIDAGNLTTPGFERERPRSVERKGASGDWKLYFTDDARRWFKEEAGETLVGLGYEQRHDW